MSQPGQDPALHHLDADFDLRLVTSLVGPRRDHCGAVMPRHVGVGSVHQRLVEAGARDPRTQIVAHDLSWHAAEECERVDMGADPVRQRLAPHRLGVGIAGRTQYCDEDLRPARLTGCPVEHLHDLTSEVDEHPLAGHMDLP